MARLTLDSIVRYEFFGKNQDKNPIVIKVHEDIAKHQKRFAIPICCFRMMYDVS